MPDNNWIKQTVNIPNFEIDVKFYTGTSYFGGDQEFDQLIGKPEFGEFHLNPKPRKNTFTTTRRIHNHVEELIKYYESVIAFSRKYDKKLESYFFRISPFIKNIDTQEELIRLSWTDTFFGTQNFLDTLKLKQEGLLFWDEDQGWELKVENHNSKIYFQDSDPQSKKIHYEVNVDRDELVKQVEFVLPQTEIIIDKLIAHFGIDYWCKSISYQERKKLF